jgi:hypothetical protein
MDAFTGRIRSLQADAIGGAARRTAAAAKTNTRHAARGITDAAVRCIPPALCGRFGIMMVLFMCCVSS